MFDPRTRGFRRGLIGVSDVPGSRRTVRATAAARYVPLVADFCHNCGGRDEAGRRCRVCEAVEVPAGFRRERTRRGTLISWRRRPLGETLLTSALQVVCTLPFALMWMGYGPLLAADSRMALPWLIGTLIPVFSLASAAITLLLALRRTTLLLEPNGRVTAWTWPMGLRQRVPARAGAGVELNPAAGGTMAEFDLYLRRGGVRLPLVGGVRSLHAARWLMRQIEQHRRGASA